MYILKTWTCDGGMIGWRAVFFYILSRDLVRSFFCGFMWTSWRRALDLVRGIVRYITANRGRAPKKCEPRKSECRDTWDDAYVLSKKPVANVDSKRREGWFSVKISMFQNGNPLGTFKENSEVVDFLLEENRFWCDARLLPSGLVYFFFSHPSGTVFHLPLSHFDHFSVVIRISGGGGQTDQYSYYPEIHHHNISPVISD